MFHSSSDIQDFSRTENLEEVIHTSRPLYVDIQLWMFNVFIPLCAVIIIIVNFIIVVSSGLILHKGQQPRSTYIFLGNVALSDLIMGVTVLFGQFYHHKENRTEMTCCVIMGLTVASTFASVYSVGLIAIDRYLYILYGLQYQRYISSLKARLMILGTWVIGVIIGFLPAMGFRLDTDNGKLCWFVILLPPEILFITVSFGAFPLVWIIILYIIILKHALKKINELKKAGENADGIQSGALRLFRGHIRNTSVSVLDDERNNIDMDSVNSTKTNKKFLRIFKRKHKKNITKIDPVYNPSKWKAIKIVLFTTGSFFITWFPFYMAAVLYALCNPESTPYYCNNLRVALASPLYILGLINSILNPIIYAWWHNGFRESVKKLCKNMCCHRNSFEPTLEHTASTRTRTSALSRNSTLGRNNISIENTDFHQESPDIVPSCSEMTSGSDLDNSDREQKTVILKSRRKLRDKRLNEETEII